MNDPSCRSDRYGKMAGRKKMEQRWEEDGIVKRRHQQVQMFLRRRAGEVLHIAPAGRIRHGGIPPALSI
eukprot:scaffold3940_cov101-Skeletonema_dohrnii-CCMP3373.AAC.9